MKSQIVLLIMMAFLASGCDNKDTANTFNDPLLIDGYNVNNYFDNDPISSKNSMDENSVIVISPVIMSGFLLTLVVFIYMISNEGYN